MARNNSINNTTFFVQFPTNDAAPTPGSGGVLAVNAGHQPYYNNATATYGLPLVNNGGIPPQEGEMLVANAAGSWATVPLGTDGYVWTAGATTAGWEAPAASPGLATFLCETGDNLPTNGVNISLPGQFVTFGALQADLPNYFAEAGLTVVDNTFYSFQLLSDPGNAASQMYFSTFNGTSATHAQFMVEAARGSFATPATIANNDILFDLNVAGQRGAAIADVTTSANIKFVAEDNFTSSNAHPCGIRFFTSGSTGASTQRASINKDGLFTASFGVSTTSAVLSQYLQIAQNDGIPTIGSGLTFGVTTSNLPYAKDSTSTFGIPMILGGSAGSAQGDLQVGNATGTYDVLAIGTSGYLLKSNGTTAAWTAPDYAPIVTGGAGDTVGQATIAATTSVVTVNTTAVAAGSRIFVSISGFTGTASLALGPIATGNRVNGTSFDITIATAVPSASTVVVDWFIITP